MSDILSQAAHIFRKDTGALWPQISILWALLALFVAYDPMLASAAKSGITDYCAPLIMVACWFLCAGVVHQEALTGNREFWLTRPYRRDSLLLAKLLFVVTFICLPVLISGGVLMVRAGVPVLPNAGELILLSVARSTWLILPPFAMACITSGFKQVVLVVTALVFATTVVIDWAQSFFGAMRPAGIVESHNVTGVLAMVAIACIAIVFQFNRRRTVQTSGLLACAVIALALPLFSDGLMALPTRILNPGFDPDRIQIAFDETVPVRWDNRPTFRTPCGNLALKITGLPDGATLTPFGDSGGSAQVRTASGQDLRASMSRGSIEKQADGYWENLCIFDLAQSASERAEPLTLRWSMGFTVQSTESVTQFPVRQGSFAVGTSGHCEVGQPDFLMCRIAPPAFGELSIGLENAGYRSFSVNAASNEYFYPAFNSAALTPVSKEAFYSPPGEGGLPWPIEDALSHPDARFVFRKQRVIGVIQRELVYRGLRFTR